MGNEQPKMDEDRGDGGDAMLDVRPQERKASLRDIFSPNNSHSESVTPATQHEHNHDNHTDDGGHGNYHHGDENVNHVLHKDYLNNKLRQTLGFVSALKNSSIMGEEGFKSSFFVSEGGLKLFTVQWKPRALVKIGGKKMRFPGGPKALVFILHGAGEHCQCYETMGCLLSSHGFMVCSHDHVGHGLSEGDRVHVNDFKIYCRDVVQHINIVRQKYPHCPLFILGHSMGGAIALKTVLDFKDLPIQGLILIGPAIVPNPETSTPVRLLLARMVSKIRPQFEVASIEPEWICRDPDIVKKYREDPLVWHGGLKARWAVCLLDALSDIQSRMAEITCPLLIMHGTRDKLCEISGSDMLDQHAGSQDKSYKVYEDGYHQLHNEPDGMGPEVMQEISTWILKRL